MAFDIPQSLTTAIQNRNCVPFVGAGLSMTILRADNGKRLFCNWHDLLLDAATKLQQEHKTKPANAITAALDYIEDDSYHRAANIAIKELSKQSFNQFLSDKFEKQLTEVDKASLGTAELVWQLGSELVLTTNYDKVLQWASINLDNHVDTQTVPIDAEYKLQQLCEKDPNVRTVLHLHGSVDNINKIVLTPDGYQALYGDDLNQATHQAALKTLQILLTRKRMLFIGFSFADKTFYHQIKLINDIFDDNGPKHYVLCRHSEKEAIDRLQLPLETVCFDQHKDLPKLLNQLSQLATQPQTEQQQAPQTNQQAATTEKASQDNNVFFVPYRAKGDAVVGREDKLQQLAAQLQSGKQTSIGHATGFKGMGGVGKTQLAIEYAYRYQHNYPKGVIWLTADQDIDSQLLDCAKFAKWVSKDWEDKNILTAAKRRLKSYT